MKINLIFSLLVIFTISSLYSQKNLSPGISFPPNTSTLQKSNILLDSSQNNLRIDNDKALFFAQEALKYAKEANSWKSILNAYQDIGEAHRFSNNRDDAHLAYDNAIKIAQEHKNEEAAAPIFKLKGHLFALESDFETTIDLYKKTEQYAAEHNDTSMLADSYLDIGVIYARQGKFYVAVEYFFKSLELYEAIGNQKYIIPILNNIGSIYQDNKEYDKALIYLNKAKKRFDKEGGQDRFLIHLLNNLGTTHKNLKQHDKAIEYYDLALEKSKEIEDDYFIARTESNIAQLYLEEDKYEQSLSFSKKALVTLEKDNYQQEVAICAVRLAIIYRNQKNYLAALKYAKKAHEINLSINRLSGLVSSYQELALINKEIGNSALAYEYLEQYVEIRDSVFDIDKTEEFVQLEAKYNYEQEELLLTSEINLLKKDKFIQQSRQTILILVLISILIALLALFWVFNNNKKKTVLLEKDLENKELIEKQAIVLEKQAKELQRLVVSKSNFFANISHELRTPLTLIIGPIQNVLTKYRINKSAKEELHIVQRNALQLKQLVNQILDLSKSDNQKLTAHVSSFSFNDLLNGLIKEFTSFAQYQNIDFQIPISASNISIHSDKEKLFIIIKNMLSNAFKYTTSQGKITLNYIEKNDEIEVFVEDNGRGISEKDIPFLFNRYYQVQSKDAPIEGGTGLGLAICKEYIELLNGNISVESHVGKGSRFTIVFPKNLVVEDRGQIELDISKEKDELFLSENISIPDYLPLQGTINISTTIDLLIVEDNLDICKYLQSILKTDYNLTFVHNGQEALKKLETYRPSLIITDLMMPIMDGFDFLKRLKQNKNHQLIPVITLTARTELIDKIKVLTIGIDDYLTKPFVKEELLASIKNLLINQQNRISANKEAEGDINLQAEGLSNNLIAFKNHHSSEDILWLENMQNIIKQNISNTNFNVLQLSQEMTISSSQLNRKTKMLVGLTPKAMINFIRFHDARQSLETKKYSTVKAVAYSIGFKDEKHFARSFKDRFGKYPSEYIS